MRTDLDLRQERREAEGERGVQPPQLSKRQKGRKGERKTESKIRKCNECTLHLVLHLPANASATAAAAPTSSNSRGNAEAPMI